MIWYAQNICSFTGSKPRKVLISPSILARNVQNARQYRLNNTFCSSLYISFPPGQTSITFHPARKNDHMVLHILSFMAKRWNLQLKSLFSSTFFLNQTHQSWWITLKYIFCDPYIDYKKIVRRMNFPINKFIILENEFHIFFHKKCIIYCFALRKISIGSFNIFTFFWIIIITARIYRLQFLFSGCTNLAHVTHQSYSFKPYFSCRRKL